MYKQRGGYKIMKLDFWLLYIGNKLLMWMGSLGVSYPPFLKSRASAITHTGDHTQRASHRSKSSPIQFPSPVTLPQSQAAKTTQVGFLQQEGVVLHNSLPVPMFFLNCCMGLALSP